MCIVSLLGTAAKKFDNLRKRFTRKKKKLIEVSPSGSGTSDVTGAKKEEADYAFIEWLSPYQTARKSSTNLIDDTDVQENVAYDAEYAEDIDNLETLDGNETDASMDDKVVTKPPETATIKPRRRENQNDLRNREIDLMKGMETIIKRRLEPSVHTQEENMDAIFGKMISSEMPLFPEEVKFELKHEITDLIYKYKVQERRKRQCIQPPPTPIGSTPASSPPMYSPNTASPVYSPLNSVSPVAFMGGLIPPVLHTYPNLPNMQLMRSDNQIPQHSQEQAKWYTDLDKLQNDH